MNQSHVERIHAFLAENNIDRVILPVYDAECVEIWKVFREVMKYYKFNLKVLVYHIDGVIHIDDELLIGMPKVKHINLSDRYYIIKGINRLYDDMQHRLAIDTIMLDVAVYRYTYELDGKHPIICDKTTYATIV